MVRVKRLELIRQRQQILNLPRLPIPPHPHSHQMVTHRGFEPQDTLIKSQVLYQLS